MLDETISTETPPLSSGYGRLGQQVQRPITGNRAKRVLHGALNLQTGAVVLWITDRWDQDTHQDFLRSVRASWRGWHIVLFEDRGSPHTAEESREVATALHIEIRLLPVAPPALHAMDPLWRHVKRQGLAHRATVSIDTSADMACQYLLALSSRERLRKAGVRSGHFWLAL